MGIVLCGNYELFWVPGQAYGVADSEGEETINVSRLQISNQNRKGWSRLDDG